MPEQSREGVLGNHISMLMTEKSSFSEWNQIHEQRLVAERPCQASYGVIREGGAQQILSRSLGGTLQLRTRRAQGRQLLARAQGFV